MTLYRYGAIAWVWRLLIAGALLGGGTLAVAGARLGSVALLCMGGILVAPALFFGSVVVVSLERESPGVLRIGTLLFWQRTITINQLGAPRVRRLAQSHSGSIYAPRVWIPVHGALPIYIDLLGTIMDRAAFASLLGVPGSAIPR